MQIMIKDGYLYVLTKSILYSIIGISRMKKVVLLCLILLLGCSSETSITKLATDNPLVYMTEDISFSRLSDWQKYEPIRKIAMNLSQDDDGATVRSMAFYVSNSKEYNAHSVEGQVGESVIDIFEKTEGVCYDGAVLLVALARWNALPARVVFPLYSNHAFAQVFVNGDWINVDATFGDVKYNFEYKYPLYLYKREISNKSLFHRELIHNPNYYKLSIPVYKETLNDEKILASLKRLTNGYSFICNLLECGYEETEEEFQEIFFGFEASKFNGNPTQSLLLVDTFEINMPAGEYKLEYLTESSRECFGSYQFSLSTNTAIKKSQIKKC